MSIEFLEEYTSEFQKYKKGDYEYGTIVSPKDIEKSIERGKKIVFTEGKVETVAAFFVGGIFLIIGLIITAVISVLTPEINITPVINIIIFGIFGTIFLVFLVLGLWKLRTSFIVLGPEGIVYKLRTGVIKGYKWEDINMDSHNLIQLHILMPNRNFISLGDYSSKEFPKLKSYSVTTLIITTFINYYYNYGKKQTTKLQRISIEGGQQHITNSIKKSPSLTIDIDKYLKELKEEFHKYKNKKYRFGSYGTSEQIRNEFSKGKAFVLKGGLRGLEWGYIIFFCISGLVACLTVASFYEIGFGIFLFFFCALFGLPFLIKLRNFIVIGPWGVYYRKISSSGYFPWNFVATIEGLKKRIIMGGSDIATSTVVVVNLSSGAKIKFESRTYLNKEFPKKIEREMFFKLFYIYFQLGQNLNF